MKLHHTSWYWFAVAAVLLIALFTLGDAHGMGRRVPDQGGGPSVPRDPGIDKPAGGELKPQRDRDDIVKRERGSGVTDQSTADKAKRAGKRTFDRGRHGGGSGVDE